MALITCPECGREISDRAEASPNCGFPITKSEEMDNELQVRVGYIKRTAPLIRAAQFLDS